MYDLQQQSTSKDWIGRVQYAAPIRLLNYEVGTFRSIRWVVSPKQCLWNTGAIVSQVNVTAPINAGDGASGTLVDGTRNPGQPGATHTIQLASGPSTAIKNGTMLTLHTVKTNAYGVTGGVDFNAGNNSDMMVDSVDTTAHTVTFKSPVMIDYKTDLGGGVYAYCTLAIHVQASTFIGGPDAVVNGIGRPPRLHAPNTVDDFDQIFRFSWDSYQGYQMYNPDVIETIFSAGTVRTIGTKLQ